MSKKVIGQSINRWDAYAKVTGKARYTADIPTDKKLYAKICRATITHGIVKNYDISEALEVEGVIKIVLPEDLPDYKFPTAGHPYTLIKEKQDVADRNLLTRKVRLYGDEIAAVIAETKLAADIAARKIKVEYEEYPIYLEPEEALAEGAVEIHEGTKNNIIAATDIINGDMDKGFEESEYIFEGEYRTPKVQHCHMESQIAYAYQDIDGRWVCVSSTQIPHICRRILGQAFNMPWGQFRVIKPFIGGGFGNKQDITIEPLTVALSMVMGGKIVELELEREEVLFATRVRHAISYKFKLGLDKDKKIKALETHILSNNGAYASHGHVVGMKGMGILATLYHLPNFRYEIKTVYTNTATAGAFRGYGVPQVIFAIESFMDDVARRINMEPIDFRMLNMIPEEVKEKNRFFDSARVDECIMQGKEAFRWEERKEGIRKENEGRKDFKRGIGMAAYSYASGTYPKAFEIAGCHIRMNQDGTVKLSVGATEIGQGSDTVFKQMAAETLGISPDKVFVDALTDTDYAPYDPGAFASRQSYITGMAVKKASENLKKKIFDAVKKFEDIEQHLLDIVDGEIIISENGRKIISISDLALKTFYHNEKAELLFSEVSHNAHDQSYPMGTTFVEVEVDLKTGRVEVIDIMNVHDSGIILNPVLASGQVEGGIGMGIPYALAEELKYDVKSGKPLNSTLLDYKMPTSMDLPNMDMMFIEKYDPYGPYGNKALGENPLCSPAAAIRNAIVDATGIEINEIPITPQKLFDAIREERGK